MSAVRNSARWVGKWAAKYRETAALFVSAGGSSKQAKRWCERDSEPPQLADIARSA